MNTRILGAALLALALSPACGEKEEDDTAATDDSSVEGDADTDTDSDTDSDSDTDTDSDSDTDPEYTAWEGEEVYVYGQSLVPADYTCTITWATSGSPTAAALCEGCDFGFDLNFTYDASASSDPTGACADIAGDMAYSYAYTPDYYGYEALMLYFEYYSAWYYYFAASFDEASGDMDYYTGYIDYPYSGYYTYYTTYYFTSVYSGTASVTK